MVMKSAPQLIRDRKINLRKYQKCCVGSELVDWLLNTSCFVHTRSQAIGIWQALLEGRGILHGKDGQFKCSFRSWFQLK